MFFHSLKNGSIDPMRGSFDRYYIPLVKSNAFNALTDNKPFLNNLQKQTRSVWKTSLNVKETMIIQH